VIEQAVSAQSSDLPARLICILGMHRSGTSYLAGSLQQAGLALGDAHTWNPHNRKGNRENQQFVDLHDSILKANGGAWDKPLRKQGAWSQQHRDDARALLREHASDAIFGFKDPRALQVLDGWLDVYPNAEFVGIFRHPNSVATSLARRDGMPRWRAMRLWYAYNNLLYKHYQKTPFPLLCFDEDEAVLDEKMLKVAADMNLPIPPRDEKFYSSELRSSSDLSKPRLPWKVGRLYSKLKQICL